MKHELIKRYSGLFIVDESKINLGDWFYLDDANILAQYISTKPTEGAKRVIAYLPFNGHYALENVPLLPPLVDDVIGKPMHDYVNEKHNQDRCIGFIDGYNKAKETYKFTEEDIMKVCSGLQGHTVTDSEALFNDIIQSIPQPKMPTHFEWGMKLGSFEEPSDYDADVELSIIPKTTTNVQGQVVACGKYIYE